MNFNKNNTLIIGLLFLLPNIILAWIMFSNIKLANNIYALDYKNQLTYLILATILVPVYIIFKANRDQSNVTFWSSISILLIVAILVWLYFLRSFQGLF